MTASLSRPRGTLTRTTSRAATSESPLGDGAPELRLQRTPSRSIESPLPCVQAVANTSGSPSPRHT
jgi:hypothetical protein